MTIEANEIPWGSPYVESVAAGRTLSAGSTIRPAEAHWHLVVVRTERAIQPLLVGPLSGSGSISYGAGGEILWVKFRLGVFMPHLPTRAFRDVETALPGASRHSFWLDSSTWQIPDEHNVDAFVDRLVRAGVLAFDPLVPAALRSEPLDVSPRTLRHRFLRAAGLTHTDVYQILRAQRAAAMLAEGLSILDTVDAAGYFDQPHLTRALRRWVGHTPAEIIRMNRPDCRSVQDSDLSLRYDTDVLETVSAL